MRVYCLLIPYLFLFQCNIHAQSIPKPTSNASVTSLKIKQKGNQQWIRPTTQEVNVEDVLQQLSKNEGYSYTIKKQRQGKTQQKHYRSQQSFKGIPIEGAVFNIHKKEDKVHLINGHVVTKDLGNEKPYLPETKALRQALKAMKVERYAWEQMDYELHLKERTENATASHYPQGELVWWTKDIPSDKASFYLAYKFNVFSIAPFDRQEIYVDASTGKVLDKQALIHRSEELGSGINSDGDIVPLITTFSNNSSRYLLKNSKIETRNGGGYFPNYPQILFDWDNYWTQAPEAVDVHWAMQQWVDYFEDVFAWSGYNGYGAKLEAHVNHYGSGAGWNGSYAFFSNGTTESDIVWHEFIHALIQSTANLKYENESGALNESFADIFATIIEHYTIPNEADWEIADIRSLLNPNLYNHPDTYEQDYWYTGTGDYGGVHTNSGVQNYWFYVLHKI